LSHAASGNGKENDAEAYEVGKLENLCRWALAQLQVFRRRFGTIQDL